MPGRLLALVVAIAFAMVLPGVTAEAERPEGSAASLARARILYIWANDAQARDDYDTLLSDFGALFTTVHVGQVAVTDLTPFDYIVIGHDTVLAGDQDWGVEGKDDEEHVFESNRSILGIGDGGAYFWG